MGSTPPGNTSTRVVPSFVFLPSPALDLVNHGVTPGGEISTIQHRKLGKAFIPDFSEYIFLSSPGFLGGE